MDVKEQLSEIQVRRASVVKEMGEHQAAIKKRRKDEELALQNIELLTKNRGLEKAKEVVNLPLMIQYKEAISGNRAILEGVREAILLAAASIERGQKILAEMDKWISTHEKQFGKVIPFDRNRSKTQSQV